MPSSHTFEVREGVNKDLNMELFQESSSGSSAL